MSDKPISTIFCAHCGQRTIVMSAAPPQATAAPGYIMEWTCRECGVLVQRDANGVTTAAAPPQDAPALAPLLEIERRIMDARDYAFHEHYRQPHGQHDTQRVTGYDAIIIYDDVLSILREVLQGAGGAAGALTDAQRKRVGREWQR